LLNFDRFFLGWWYLADSLWQAEIVDVADWFVSGEHRVVVEGALVFIARSCSRSSRYFRNSIHEVCSV